MDLVIESESMYEIMLNQNISQTHSFIIVNNVRKPVEAIKLWQSIDNRNIENI